MEYILYFLGFVSFYRISEHLSEEDTEEWQHILVATVWPALVVFALLRNLYALIFGESE